MSDYQAGTAFLQIAPSLLGFSRQLQRELRGVNTVYDLLVRPELDRTQTDRVQAQLRATLRTLPVPLDIDASPADRELAALRTRIERLAGKTIGIDISGDQARTEVQAIDQDLQRLEGRHPDIAVRTDARGARTELAGVSAEVDRLDGRTIRLDVDARNAIGDALQLRAVLLDVIEHKYDLTIDANTGGAVANIALLIAKVGVLGGLSGVIAGFGGALGGLGAAGAVAGAGAVSSILAFAGVGDALTALGAQQDAAATTARTSAKQQTASAYAVAGAQDRVKQASESANRARVEGARSVSDAEKAAGKQVEQALTAQASAQKALRSATSDLRREQDTLTDAWEAGRRSLEDLQSQVAGNRLDQRQAALDLKDAEKELAAARQSGNKDAIDRATLAYDRQVQTVKDLQTQAGRLATDNADAQKKGVAGSDQVVAANERIAAAQDRVGEATAAAKAADVAVVQARIDGAESVGRAQEAATLRIEDADHQVVESQRALQQALAQTGDAGASSADKVATAMANLSPAGQSFVKFLFGAKQQVQELGGVAQTALFPPLQAGLQALLSQQPAISGMVSKLAGATGGALNTILTTLANPTWMSFFGVLADASTTILPALAQLFLHGADAARELLMMLLPLAPAGIALANQFLSLFQILAPFIVQLLAGLIPAASAFLGALAPLGPVLQALGPILGVLAQAFTVVLIAALQALTPILIALTPLLEQFAMQWAIGLVQAITTATPLLVRIFQFLSDHAQTVVTITTFVLGLVGAFKPLLFGLGAVLSVLHGWLLWRVISAVLERFGLAASPIARILELFLHPLGLLRSLLPLVGRAVAFLGRAVLGALGPFGILLTVLGFLYSSNEQFRNAINGVLQVLLGLVMTLVNALMPAFNAVMGAIEPLIPLIIGALMPVFNVLVGILIDLVNTVMPPLVDILTTVVIPIIVKLADILAKVLVWVITNVVVPAIQGFAWFLSNVLVPVITWLWENIIQPVFKAIGEFISWVFTNVVLPVFDALVWYINNILIPVYTFLWENVIKPVFQAIGEFIGWVWTNLIQPIFDFFIWYYRDLLWNGVVLPVSGFIVDAFRALGEFFVWVWENLIRPPLQALGDFIGWVWTNLIKPGFDAIGGGLTWLQDGFRTAVDWIGQKWNELRGLLAKPINFLIGTVWNDGILTAWNWAADLLGLGHVAPLPLIPEMATGGLLQGPGTGTSDSILGVGANGAPVVKVSNGEFVVNADTTRKTLPFLTALNAGNGEALQAAGGLGRVVKMYRGPKSGIPAYAAGGPIDERVMEAKRWLAGPAQGIPYAWGGTVTPNMAGTDCSGMQAAVTHILSGRSPYSGRIGTTATMPWGGFVPGIDGAYAIGNKPSDHMAATLAGDNVEQHGPSGTPFSFPSRWGADASYFTQQFHLQQLAGQFVSGGEGGGINWILQQVKDYYTSVTDPAIDLLGSLVGAPPPAFRETPVALARTVRDKIGDFLFGKAEEVGGEAVDVSGITGPVQDQVREVAKRYGWDQGPQWTALSNIISHESGWNPNAKNPGSSAAGLFQKMVSIHGPVESTPAGQAVWGLDYISGRYRDPLNAWSFWQQHHSYDDGGIGKGIGWMWKGTGLDERVLPPQETQAYPTLTRLSQQLEAGRLPTPTGVSDQQYAAALSGARGGEGERGGDTFHLHGLDHYTPRRVATEVQRVRDFDERLT
jgi:hypothetical protein